jgi:diaminopimelate decarboxylase
MVKFNISHLINKSAANLWKKNYSLEYFFNVKQHQHKILDIIGKNNTPIFIGDLNIVIDRHQQLHQKLSRHWGDQHQIFFSFKTNYSLAENNLLKKLDIGAEVVSEKEYLLAKKIGYKKIIYNGPYKTRSSYLKAIKDRTIIHIDNFSEIDLIKRLPSSYRKRAVFGLRISTKYHHRIPRSRFGFSIDNHEANRALTLLREMKVNIQSLHIHLGTDVYNLNHYEKAAQNMANFIQTNSLFSIKYLDFGGGFPAHGRPPYGRRNWPAYKIEKYVQAISSQLRPLWGEKCPTLILEPGRYLIDDAIILISEIIDSKINNSKQIVMANSTVIMMPTTYYRPQIIKSFSSKIYPNLKKEIPTKIFGASCKEDDLLYEGKMARAKIGDFLIHFNAGAYNENMTSNFIFKKPQTVFISEFDRRL